MEKRKYFLVYPDIQEILERAAKEVRDSEERYDEKQERLVMKALKLYSDEIHYYATNLSQIKSWKNTDYQKARYLYSEYERLLNEYKDSFEDISKRISTISKFFKQIGRDVNSDVPHIRFKFKSRLKSFLHFLQKAITLLESDAENWDIISVDESEYDFKIKRYYDTCACTMEVNSASIISIKEQKDYLCAEQDCYEIMNSACRVLERYGCKIYKPVSVGNTSNNIDEKYRSYIKDYISNPKPNGYRALHVSFRCLLEDESLITFELQVKSQLMSILSEDSGVWSHEVHKKNSKLPLDVDLTQVKTSEFICEDVNNEIYMRDDAGLEIGKPITRQLSF